MKKLKCIIIDDEPIAVNYIQQYILKLPQLELLNTYHKASDAYNIVLKGEVDLIFLDIQMPEITGLDFIRTLPNTPAIILITAYSEYALEGFDLNVTDYLLKPVAFNRFVQAVNKVNITSINSSPIELNERKDFIFLKSGYKSIKIQISDIIYIEGNKEYVTFFTSDEKKYIKNERLKNIEQQFMSHGFIRVHKSYLINIQKVVALYGNTIELINTIKIPIGRTFKESLKNIIED